MKFTIAIALLLNSSQAIKLSTKSQFPAVPVSGNDVASVIGEQLDGVLEEVPQTVQSTVNEINRKLVGAMSEAGVDFSSNVYDPQFISSLIEFEYKNFLKDYHENQDRIGQEIQTKFDQLTSEATEAGFAQLKAKQENNCFQLMRERDQECPPDVPDEEQECPGPCCFREPKDEAEEVAIRGYRRNKRRETKKRVIDCMTQEPEIAELEQAIGDPKQIANQITRMIEDIVREQENPESDKQLLEIIRGINAELTQEANRLGVEITPTSLPKPAPTAAKIFKFIKWLDEQAATEEGQQHLLRAIRDIRFQVISAAYGYEQMVKKVTQEVDPQQQLQKLATELDAGTYDNEIKEIAGQLTAAGLTTNQSDLKDFALASADALSGESGEDLLHIAHGVLSEAEREGEAYAEHIEELGEEAGEGEAAEEEAV